MNDTNRIEVSATEDEIQDYRKKERKSSRKVSLPIIFLLIWVGLYFISLIFGVSIYLPGTGGEGYNRASYFVQHVTLFAEYTYNLFFHAGSTGSIEMFYCQFLGVALAGAALAACGAAFQGVFKNVLAGPSTMGVMSGGSMGCMVYLLLFWGISAEKMGVLAQVSDLLQPIFTLAGCFGGVFLILAVSLIAGKGKVSSDTMVIAGTVFSGVISNIMLVVQYWIIANDACVAVILLLGRLAGDRTGNPSVLKMVMAGSIINQGLGTIAMYYMYNLSEEDLMTYQEISMGTYVDLSKLSMGIFFCVMAIALIPMILIRYRFNVTGIDDAEARAAGVNPASWRLVGQICGVLMVTAAMIHCGEAGMLAMVIPFIVRNAVGSDFRKVFTFSALSGASLMMVCRTVSTCVALRNSYGDVLIDANQQVIVLPATFIVNICLLPFFILILTRQRSTFE